jgi:S-DNA-T family DNA segregation ATPase FtsK/SpoIIIE
MSLAIIMIWASVTLAKFMTPFFSDAHFNPGGDHGLAICEILEGLVGAPGLTLLLAISALAFLIYLSAETIFLIRKIFNPLHYLKKIPMEINIGKGDREDKNEIETVEDPTVFDDPEEQVVNFDNEEEEEKKEEEPVVINHRPETVMDDAIKPDTSSVEMTVETGEKEETATGKDLVGAYGDITTPYDPKRDLENYHYPTLDLLKKYDDDGKPYIDMSEQTANKNRIVDVLRNFGVEISSIKATVGPTITLYEITPAPGVRISKIRNLEDDIALSLSALGIRIIAPIPGKGTIGIEVPNAKPSIVSMESILNSKKFQETTMELPCAVGKTITNEVFMFDLAKAPHLLVAGATGQGKSVGLNAILTSLLYKKHPAELKIVLVDPKKVEFSIYISIEKHFLAKVPDDDADPIITDVTKVVRTLNSLCKEMDTRYDLLKMAQARNLKEYNKKFIDRQLNPEHGHKFMPYIVVVIDEFGDLIMTAGKEVELPIARIAQLARAVGIHMIIATQRPTTNIITGTIKANFPSRIAFKVSAMIDSRTILDRPGAQQLVGRGDMLYLAGGEPVRVQCAFVDTPEVERINQFIAQQQGYLTAFELPEPDMPDDDMGEAADVDMQHLDPMFEDAARLIVINQSGSTSLIQRKFAIGYNRAGRLMDQLEKAGVVGAAHGSKPREVLIQDEVSLDNLLNQWRR